MHFVLINNKRPNGKMSDRLSFILMSYFEMIEFSSRHFYLRRRAHMFLNAEKQQSASEL